MGYIVEYNVEIVNCWENIGILIFGCINIFEFGIKGIMELDVWGVCYNFWNLKYNSGGLLGGFVFVVVVGIVLIVGVGDGGGLIWIFVLYCGLFGLKLSCGCMLWGLDMSEVMYGVVI